MPRRKKQEVDNQGHRIASAFYGRKPKHKDSDMNYMTKRLSKLENRITPSGPTRSIRIIQMPDETEEQALDRAGYGNEDLSDALLIIRQIVPSPRGRGKDLDEATSVIWV